MNREIKFRAWDKVNKLMAPIASMRFPVKDDELFCIHVDMEDTKEFIPSQYTGLKDKNGKEIYEGDVCKFIIGPNEERVNPLEALTVIIRWANAAWGWEHTHPELVVLEDRKWRAFWDSEDGELWDMKYFEVIGNVYENPELLK